MNGEAPKATEPTWAICELIGHVRLAGRLSEEERFGVKMGRLDIPDVQKCPACEGTGQAKFMSAESCPECKGAKTVEKWMTQYFGGSSVYRISIVAEAVARHVAAQTQPAPVQPWDFPRHVLASAERVQSDDDFDGEPDDDNRF